MVKFTCKNAVKIFLAAIIVFSAVCLSQTVVFAEDIPVESFVNGDFEDTSVFSPYWGTDNEGYVGFSSEFSYEGGTNSLKINQGEETSGYDCNVWANVSLSRGVEYQIVFRLYVKKAKSATATLSESVDKNSVAVGLDDQKGNWVTLTLNILYEGSGSVLSKINIDVKSTATGNKSSDKTICYLDGAEITKLGQEEQTVVNDGIISLQKGASIRLNETSFGLRFSGSVDRATYNEYSQKYTNVNAGVLLAVYGKVKGLNDFTFKELSSAEITYLDMKADKWLNGEEDCTTYDFYCALIDIKPQNIDQLFCARGYLRYFDGEEEKFVYSSFSEEDNVRSINQVAKALQGDYAEQDYRKKIVDYFADGVSVTPLSGFVKTGRTYKISGLEVAGGVIRINFTNEEEGRVTVTDSTTGQEIELISTDSYFGGEQTCCFNFAGGKIDIKISGLDSTPNAVIKVYEKYE